MRFTRPGARTRAAVLPMGPKLDTFSAPATESRMKRLACLSLLLVVFATPVVAQAQSVDSLVAKYIQASGGMARIQALQSLRRTGKFTGGGGFEAVVVQENKRPNSVREEFSIQGMTGINAYHRRDGWKNQAWDGERAPQAPRGEEEHRNLDG